MVFDEAGSLEGAVDNPFRIELAAGRDSWISTCGGYPRLG